MTWWTTMMKTTVRGRPIAIRRHGWRDWYIVFLDRMCRMHFSRHGRFGNGSRWFSGWAPFPQCDMCGGKLVKCGSIHVCEVCGWNTGVGQP